MNDSLNHILHEVFSRHKICVVSTVNTSGHPQSAIVGYSYNDDLEMLFGTSEKTRKYMNLQKDAHIALVIGDFESEIQYEGTAQEVNADEAKVRFTRLPGSEEYRNDPLQRWLLVTPNWLRVTVHETPNRVEEVTF